MYLALLLALDRSIYEWMNAESESEACRDTREKHVCSSDASLAIVTTAWTTKELLPSIRPIHRYRRMSAGGYRLWQANLTAQDPASVALACLQKPQAAFPRMVVRSDAGQRKCQGCRCRLRYPDSLIMVDFRTRCLPYLTARPGVALFKQKHRMTSSKAMWIDTSRIGRLGSFLVV